MIIEGSTILKLANILKLMILGIFLPVSTQGMEVEDLSCKSLDKSTGPQEGAKSRKSFRVLELLSQSKFYKHCDLTGYEKGSKLFNEETADLAYSKGPFAQKAFSEQPQRKDLKNNLGVEVEVWHTKKAKQIDDLNNALLTLQSWQNTKPGLLRTQESIDEGLKHAEFYYNSLLLQFLQEHGPEDVLKGKRQLTKEDIKNKKLKIHETPPVQIISTASTLRSYAIGTSYTSLEGSKPLEGFSVAEEELMRQTIALEQRIKVLQQEYNDMSDIWKKYKDEFLPEAVKLANYPYLKQMAEDFRKELKVVIEAKYPQALNSTHEEMILADVKRRRKLRPVQSQIRKLPSVNPQTLLSSTDEKFSKVYTGLDTTTLSTEPCSFTPKFNITKSIEVMFQIVKERRYLNDEERYKIQVMWKNPTKTSLDNLGANIIALYLRNDKLSRKVGNKNEWALEAEEGLEIRLKDAVEQNREPDPEDRRKLLDFLHTEKSLTRNEEAYTVPKGAQMVTAYPDVSYALEHRKAMNEKQVKFENLSVFDELMNPKKLKSPFDQKVNYQEKYDNLFQEYKALLEGSSLKTGYVQLLLDMVEPYGSYLNGIERGWKFVIAETYINLPVARIDPKRIEIKNAQMTDEDLDIKDRDTVFDLLFGCPKISLAQNLFKGEVSYPFTNVTHLDLSQNQLVSLNILKDLNHIQYLDLSNNSLRDLSIFFLEEGKQFASLQYLNLSHNSILDVTCLSKLKALKTLDVSNNQIIDLRPLLPQDDAQNSVRKSTLESLKANNNMLTGPWKEVLPKGLDNLKALELKGNSQLTGFTLTDKTRLVFDSVIFRDYYPALNIIRTDSGEEESINFRIQILNDADQSLGNKHRDDERDIIPKSGVTSVIDLSDGSIRDEGIALNSKDNTLRVKTNVKGKGYKTVKHSILPNAELNLWNNLMTGTQIPLNAFSSNRIVKLEISFNRLTQIDFIGELTALRYLDVSNNQIPCLVPLQNCKDLITLIANKNKLPKVTMGVFPVGLNNVETLEIQGNTSADTYGFGAFKAFFPRMTTLRLASGYYNEKGSYTLQL